MFLTGYGQTGIDPRYAGVPVLQKPFDPGALRWMVSRQLA